MDKEMWCVCIMEFYSALKKNEISSFAGNWMELEIIKLSGKANLIKTSIACFLLYMEFRAEGRA
jgi:hypothetical protein